MNAPLPPSLLMIIAAGREIYWKLSRSNAPRYANGENDERRLAVIISTYIICELKYAESGCVVRCGLYVVRCELYGRRRVSIIERRYSGTSYFVWHCLFVNWLTMYRNYSSSTRRSVRTLDGGEPGDDVVIRRSNTYNVYRGMSPTASNRLEVRYLAINNNNVETYNTPKSSVILAQKCMKIKRFGNIEIDMQC